MQVWKHCCSHVAHRARRAADFLRGFSCDCAQIKHKLIRRQKANKEQVFPLNVVCKLRAKLCAFFYLSVCVTGCVSLFSAVRWYPLCPDWGAVWTVLPARCLHDRRHRELAVQLRRGPPVPIHSSELHHLSAHVGVTVSELSKQLRYICRQLSDK